MIWDTPYKKLGDGSPEKEDVDFFFAINVDVVQEVARPL